MSKEFMRNGRGGQSFDPVPQTVCPSHDLSNELFFRQIFEPIQQRQLSKLRELASIRWVQMSVIPGGECVEKLLCLDVLALQVAIQDRVDIRVVGLLTMTDNLVRQRHCDGLCE